MNAAAGTASPTVTRRARWRRALPWLLLAAGLLLVSVLLNGDEDAGEPLDPDSVSPIGTKALVEVLRDLGAEVEVSGEIPDASTDTALLLVDEFDDRWRGELRGWVASGGDLLVVDPASTVTPVAVAGFAGAGGLVTEPLERGCDVPAFAKIPTFEQGDGVVFKVQPGSTGCYLVDGNAWALVQPIGDGTVVRLGGPATLTNGELAVDQNAGLAAAVLAPTAGTRVQVIWEDVVAPSGEGGEGGEGPGLFDLLRPGVRAALWQLAAAFAFLALWRGRRLGRPVTEPQPVELTASELVVSVGNLLQRAGRRDQVAATLADDLRRTLAERLGLPASSDAATVADAVAARTGVERDRVLDALDPRPPADEKDLVRRSQTMESIRREATRDR